MKKMLSIMVAVVMVLAMTVTAFAAPSPSEEIKAVEGTITLPDGTTVAVGSEGASQYFSVAGATKEVTAPAGTKVLKTADVTVAKGASVKVTLEVVGVKKGDKVTIVQVVDGKTVTLTGVAVADNKVEVTVTESGTLAVCVAESAASTTTTTPSTDKKAGSAAGSTASPKTGETNVAAMVAMMALVFAGVSVVAAKKANA